MEEVQGWVNTLASQKMYGRGYVFDGAQKASSYLSETFTQLGVSKVSRQTFTSPINTFPGAMSLTIDGVALRPGIDFLPDGCSSTLRGNYGTYRVSNEELSIATAFPDVIRKAKGKILVIDASSDADVPAETQSLMQTLLAYLQNENNQGIPGAILLTDKKLTHSVGDDLCWMPVFIVNKGAVGSTLSKVDINLKAKLERKFQHSNIIAYIEGTETPDQKVVFTAHYDHLGGFGEGTFFPGANDNASGTAMLLALAKYYVENPPKHTVVLIAFGGEEAGLLGSRYFVENPTFTLKDIKWLINLDILGTGEEGIKVVNATLYPEQFETLKSLNEQNGWLPAVSPRGEACNSDHCFFHQRQVPCFYMYTLGGIQAYHDTMDRPETLPLTGFSGVFQLLTAFVGTL